MDESNRDGSNARAPEQRLVSASDIARLGFCERQIRFDVLRGPRTTARQRDARRGGDAAHRAFYDESRRIADRSLGRGPCFIATIVLGATPQTLALRQFRDLVLRRSAAGRALIAFYYRYSPHFCAVLASRPRLVCVVRPPLQLLAALAGAVVRARFERERHRDA